MPKENTIPASSSDIPSTSTFNVAASSAMNDKPSKPVGTTPKPLPVSNPPKSSGKSASSPTSQSNPKTYKPSNPFSVLDSVLEDNNFPRTAANPAAGKENNVDGDLDSKIGQVVLPHEPPATKMRTMPKGANGPKNQA